MSDPGFPRPPDTGEDESEIPTNKPTNAPHPAGSRSMLKPVSPSKFDGRTIIHNQGRIAFLILPTRFALANEINCDLNQVFEYQIPDNASMKIGHWIWNATNAPFSESTRTEFLSLLSQPPHTLEAEEIEKVEEVIPPDVYGHSGAFDLVGVKTEDFGGKTVLTLETRWWDEDRRSFGLFVPSLDGDKAAESLHFEATDSDFRKTFLSAKAAFLRMKWRS